MYDSKAVAERAYSGYRASKHIKVGGVKAKVLRK